MHTKFQQGFTLIEVLIAMLVLALGLLGLAALQATTLKNNQNSYYRSQATQFAYDIADRIRANEVEALKGAASKYFMDINAAQQKTGCNSTTGCSSALMAENDLYEWESIITGMLPSGVGLVSQNGTNGFLITIRWDDNRDGDNTDANESVQTRFQL
ncbi:type IV pilus modification protein PilV [Methyloglobulus morosus KoM1]|uniref:Type IV pilus modification protein PilV n=1 Tax=Methyloglobulus morosus KoM1 TaxID=1116472 RepID=V5E3B9_9GAMM|nr:type IV pilus modification protein PilV [Methyloglobulus morosus]ESS74046.1 type IV pilus modification protein PilV [Methyloglobulus morosus KoM1]